ncbi:MAG: UDP-N-acetylmuramate--L-alanine ligase [Thermodesulfobacteriota bacterium]|nr:UDP-N-acetylmuramate--L-alanine ligase [Thermodesulfobacteriota bacterium]
MYKKIKHIHFVGIGGIGMSGIAEVLLNLGYRVSGSDIQESEITRRLSHLGGTIHYGHSKDNLEDVDVVVTSSAVRADNPEVTEAEHRLIPVIPRAEMLAELMRMKYGIAVSGTHGKTTTTSMIATVLSHGDMDPTVIIGGRLNSLGTNAKLGQGEFLVAEADESDGSFLKLSPTIAVVTNIDQEHMDHYKDMEEVRAAYLDFVNKIPFYGMAVICLDHENIQALIPQIKKRYITYGMTSQADIQAREVVFSENKTAFEVLHCGTSLGKIQLQMPGIHNVYNALATISAALELDLDFKTIQEGLNDFTGIHRRFQIKGQYKDILIVDDYAHHPVEIKTTLSAAKNGWKKRVIAVFQPHRFSRTKDLYEDFLVAFYQADILIVTEIYPASEDPLPGIDAKTLSDGIKEHGHKNVSFISDKGKIASHLMDILEEGDMILTLGAGDVYKVGDALIDTLKLRT